MLNGKRIAVVLTACNAARTLSSTIDRIPPDLIDDAILVDDGSRDGTAQLAHELGVCTLAHIQRRGPGAAQKTGYAAALSRGADVVVMLGAGRACSTELIGRIAAMASSGEFDVVLGSRMLGARLTRLGMPVHRYAANVALTLMQNLLTGQRLSGSHTGFRAWTREVLTRLPLMACSDEMIFDDQMLAQCVYFGFRIGELACSQTEPEPRAAGRSARCVPGVLQTSWQLCMKRWGWARPEMLEDNVERRLRTNLQELCRLRVA
jgi:glycosyltransferase involved in cell wall biosynthesis